MTALIRTALFLSTLNSPAQAVDEKGPDAVLARAICQNALVFQVHLGTPVAGEAPFAVPQGAQLFLLKEPKNPSEIPPSEEKEPPVVRPGRVFRVVPGGAEPYVIIVYEKAEVRDREFVDLDLLRQIVERNPDSPFQVPRAEKVGETLLKLADSRGRLLLKILTDPKIQPETREAVIDFVRDRRTQFLTWLSGEGTVQVRTIHDAGHSRIGLDVFQVSFSSRSVGTSVTFYLDPASLLLDPVTRRIKILDAN